jgi:hypothetical protein
MGHGKEVPLTLEGSHVSVRDYGRGIPLGKASTAYRRLTQARNTATTGLRVPALNGSKKVPCACQPHTEKLLESIAAWLRCVRGDSIKPE